MDLGETYDIPIYGESEYSQVQLTSDERNTEVRQTFPNNHAAPAVFCLEGAGGNSLSTAASLLGPGASLFGKKRNGVSSMGRSGSLSDSWHPFALIIGIAWISMVVFANAVSPFRFQGQAIQLCGGA